MSRKEHKNQNYKKQWIYNQLNQSTILIDIQSEKPLNMVLINFQSREALKIDFDRF